MTVQDGSRGIVQDSDQGAALLAPGRDCKRGGERYTRWYSYILQMRCRAEAGRMMDCGDFLRDTSGTASQQLEMLNPFKGRR